MLDKASATSHGSAYITYPIHDSTLPFSDYITQSRRIIRERRIDLASGHNDLAQLIIDTNSPYELRPAQQAGRVKYGALLIHGLLDCPFSLRDLGTHLQSAGMLCRSILLPGHGTIPDDLISISYHDWIQALRYGVETMKRDVDYLFLIGYSTGAALSIYQALIDNQISGVVLLAPAIRLRKPIDLAVIWHSAKKWLGLNDNPWLFKLNEIDYAKYCSIAFNPVTQVSLLTQLIRDIRHTRTLECPVFLTVSDADETISSRHALKFFSHHNHPQSQVLLYSAKQPAFDDPRIMVRSSSHPELNIQHFSHISIPFASDNPHYGQKGDFALASRINPPEETIYGAYNKIETLMYHAIFRTHLSKHQHRTLTYNPDFNFMASMIRDFIERCH